MSIYWEVDTFQELERLVNEKPLTLERIKYTLQNKIYKIVLSRFSNLAFTIPLGTGDGDYNIFIPSKFSLKERSESLIHEICHANYDACGIGTSGLRNFPLSKRIDRTKMEDIIEKEAQRFYREYPEFIDSIANNL